MILNKTSSDSIAIWTPNSVFTLPIILSQGVGIDTFIQLDPPPISTVVKQCINRKIFSYTRATMVTGTMFFHPQSLALSALRNVTETVARTGRAISGTLLIFNIQAGQFDKYTNLEWTSPYCGSSRSKVLEDVPMLFASSVPTAINIGIVTSVYNSLAGLGLV